MWFHVVYSDSLISTVRADNEIEAISLTSDNARKAIFYEWLTYARGKIPSMDEDLQDLLKSWAKIFLPFIDFKNMNENQLLESIVSEVPIPFIKKIECEGCLQCLPDQMAPTGDGGCLEDYFEDDFDSDTRAQLYD